MFTLLRSALGRPVAQPPQVLQSFTLEQNRFGIEPELTAKVGRANVRVYEVPISYFGRTYEEGKEITWKDGVRAIYAAELRVGDGGSRAGVELFVGAEGDHPDGDQDHHRGQGHEEALPD